MLDSKKTNNSALFRMALVAAAVILAAAVIVIGIAKAAKKPADDTSQEQSTVITESPVPSAASEPTREPTVAPAPVDFSVWKSVNDEIYGWLEIPDTNISYPVVQSATSDEYYLRRHYDGTSNTYGTIFSQGTYNNTGFTDRVTTLYGHDVWNEDLYFHQLHKFSDDTFFDEHTKVYTYTPEERQTWSILARTTVDDRHIMYSFHDFADASDVADFMELVQEGSESRIKADVYQTTNENSRYLILSTCHPTVPEKRCLLICVLSSIASTEYTGDGITPVDIPK